MPFIRYLKDKRGYETTLVMHAYRPVQGPQKTRVLYLFRTPSHVKLGRQPLDEESREALEHTHPDVSFDWMGLDRESAAMRRDESRERDRDRPVRARPRSHQDRPPQPVRVVIEDHSLAGRVLGAERAIALRRQYGELIQRIARRARTPEDRDRLTERAQRLNPDDWPDEGAVQAMALTVDAEREAISSELPSRRRGRRGGRRRDREDQAGAEGDDSAIMAEDGETDGSQEMAHEAGPAAVAGDGVFDAAAGPDADEQPAGDSFPDDDEFRQH